MEAPSIETSDLRRILPAVLVLSAAALAVHTVRAVERTCLPVDEAARRPDFFSFRAQLQTAVARHDAEAVIAIVDPDIRLDFGGGAGVDNFVRSWRVHESDSELWAELGEVLALGGRFSAGDAFYAPYTFECGAADGFEDVVVIGSNVRARAKPSPDAPVVATLSFAVLATAKDPYDADSDDGWEEITLEGGRRAFISSRFVRSPIDYRAGFVKKHGRWVMSAFIAGD